MLQRSKLFVSVFAATLLLALAAPVFADETNGTVKATFPDRNEIVLKGILGDTTYQLTKEAWVILDGRKCKLADVKEGDRAHISYDKKENKMIAHGARCLRKASETTGTVRFVIGDKNQLVLKGVLKDTAYFMEKDVKIYIGTKEHNFSDLKEGDQVALTYETRDNQPMVSDIRVTNRTK